MGLVVDLFAGGGGASVGIEAALGRAVDLAINHDPVALAVHAANHPRTRHMTENLWKTKPVDATGGRPVDLLWASPDCTHHSVAKGGKPLKKNIRSLAWVVVRWARDVRPRVICLENVAEFRGWGPLDRQSRPIKARKGETFRRWVRQLERLGYVVEHRVLDASHYGAPTRRRRLFLIARRDGQSIRWPEPTHGRGRLPLRTAAQCIDWDLACPSIFERKKPLAEKTLWRIAQGLRRFVLESAEPFIVRYHGQKSPSESPRVEPVAGPLPTQTTENRFGLVVPSLVEMNADNAPRGVDEPLGVVTTQHNRFNLALPTLAQASVIVDVGGRAGQSDPTEAGEPVGTVTAKNDRAVVTPLLVEVAHGKAEPRGHSMEDPLSTVTATQRSLAVVTPVLVGAGGPAGSGGPRPADEPINTVMPQNSRAVVAPVMVRTDMHKSNAGCTYGPEDQLRTITSGGGHAVAVPTLIQTGYGEREGQAARVPGLHKPLGTLVNGQKHALVSAFMAKHYGGVVGQEVEQPAATITSKDHHGLAAAALVKFRGNEANGHSGCASLEAPLPTITSGGGKGGVHVAEVRAFLTAYYGEDATSGQAVLEPLRTITAKHRLGLVTIFGIEYQIIDIGLRMLEPNELLRAQFGRFAASYDLSPATTKSGKVRLIGNSVCPEVAEAVVRANATLAAGSEAVA